jgi:hypothetical protein
MMKSKPSWAFFLAWLAGYTVLDLVVLYVWHGTLTWSDVPASLRDAVFGAFVTWLFALYKWHKADSGL